MGMWADLVQGVRALRRSPVFTTAAVLSLALGIGANTAIFSLLDQVVLRSLPVADPERLVTLHGEYAAPGPNVWSSSSNSESAFSYPFYRDLRDRVPAFSGIAARSIAPVRITWHGATQAADAELATGDYFSTVGVTALLGRVMTRADDGAPGAHPVAVLGHAFWLDHLGGDPGIVNQTIAVNGHPFLAIGVAAANFKGLVQGESPAVFVPMAMQRTIMPTVDLLADGRYLWLNLFARLNPGETLAHAQAAMDVAFHAIQASDLSSAPGPVDAKTLAWMRKQRIELVPAARGIAELRKQWEKPLAVLMFMVGFVLLIACANVAGLLVARGASRQREIAIRLALGAKRRSLVRQLLVEGLLLAVAGAAAGLLVEHWSTQGLLRILPRDAAGGWVTGPLDTRVLAYTLGLSVICTLLFALIPALQATRPDLAAAMRDQVANAVSRGSSRVRRVLVTAQVAFSLLLVVGAGLFSISAANLIYAGRGFRAERLWMFPVDATLIRTGAPAATAFYHDLLDRLAALPGVSSVAATQRGPYGGGGGWGGSVEVEGFHPGPKDLRFALFQAITPGYFRTLGVAERAGRDFNDRDTAGAAKTVIVNEAFVRHYSPRQNPIGLHVGFVLGPGTTLDREIVGVVGDTRGDVRIPVREAVYFPYTQLGTPSRLSFYIRAGGKETHLADDIRRAVREADAGLPVPEISTMAVRIRNSLYTEMLVAVLSSAFGVLATLLAAVGLYGVIAFAVARRTPEIGVRLALGAVPADVLRMVLLDAGRMAAAGIVIGLSAAFVLSRYVESQLFGIHAANPALYAGAAAVLAAVAVLAAYVPARRASRIDPVSALRYE